MKQRNPRLLALLLTLCFFGLLWLYVLEFPIISNTLGIRWLAISAMIVGFALSAGIIWRFRDRFTPLEKHRPDVAVIIVMSMVFAPLFGSMLNRALGSTRFQSFNFVSETPFVAAGYGVLQNEKIKPTGYHLIVKENGQLRKFKYKTQPYYPLTPPGAEIMLPMRQGFFGARVMLLE